MVSDWLVVQRLGTQKQRYRMAVHKQWFQQRGELITDPRALIQYKDDILPV